MILVSGICIVGHLVSSFVFYVQFWEIKNLYKISFWFPFAVWTNKN